MKLQLFVSKLDKCYNRTRLTDIPTMLNNFHKFFASEHESKRASLDFLFAFRVELRKCVLVLSVANIALWDKLTALQLWMAFLDEFKAMSL